jgi:hypothetical protein
MVESNAKMDEEVKEPAQVPKAKKAEVNRNTDLTATPQRKIADWVQYEIITQSWRDDSE